MAEDNRTIFLVLRAQSGDRAALDDLLRSCQDSLYRYLLRLLSNAADAEDALQTTLLQVCRKLGWLRDPALFRPWAYRIASRTAYRMLKRRGAGRAEWLSEHVHQLAADRNAVDLDDLELRQRIPDMLKTLSPSSREVLVLHYLEEFTIPQVASILGIPVGTAKSRLSYGLQCLRRTIGQPKGASDEFCP